MESSNQETEDEANSRQQTLEKETIKKTTVKTNTRELIGKFKEEKQRRKLSSHKNIKKSTRRRDVIIWFTLYLYRIVSYNC